jgi:iron complex transport system substrate-binding protein
MSPPITQIVYGLGAQEGLVGVTRYCNVPASFTVRPIICGDYLSPNYELILQLNPDVVLIQGAHPDLTAFCKKNDIKTISVNLEGLDGSATDILKVGSSINADGAASAHYKKMVAYFQAQREKVSKLSSKPRVLLTISRSAGSLDQIFTVGKDSFITEMIEIAGGKSVFKDEANPYFNVSIETILAVNPDVIIEIQPEASEEIQRQWSSDWKKYDMIEAVKKENLFTINDQRLLSAGYYNIQNIETLKSIVERVNK